MVKNFLYLFFFTSLVKENFLISPTCPGNRSDHHRGLVDIPDATTKSPGMIKGRRKNQLLIWFAT